MKSSTAIGTVVLLLLSLIASLGCSRLTDIEVDRKVRELQQIADHTLKPGDPPEKIVAFFKANDLGYSYDEFVHRYQSRYADAKTPRSFSGASIGVYIYVNDDGTFKNAEARKHLPD